MDDSYQSEFLAFLRSPASYPHKPAEVELRETHGSWVFIVSPFVFKVKKPVNFGFLDFSTLEKRHYFCQRELELNRRLCPEVYLDVVPIYRSGSRFSFKANGKIAEYSVKMKELQDGCFMRELVPKGLIGPREVDRVLSCLREFYESQVPRPEIEVWGKAEKLRISTDENFTQVKRFVGKTLSAAAFEAIRQFTSSFYLAKTTLFRQRIEQHRIRDCHGDLHLDHIHLTPEAVTIFDCIEFNDRFRCIDIANDLAYLAMDFDFEGRRDLGNLLLRKAAMELRDHDLLRVANFYKCYRAFVRGKVESIQAAESEEIRPNEQRKRAARYFRLALRYAIGGSKPLVLVVMGRVGAGKTTIARQLGTELDWAVFSSDPIRKALAGVPLRERTSAALREKVYSPQMTEQTYQKLLEQGLGALATHSGVILDATFSDRAHRTSLREGCARANADLEVIELDAERSTIKSRLRARDQTGDISDARLEDFEKLSAVYKPPVELFPGLVKISTNDSVSETTKAILLRLAEKSANRTKSFPR